MPVAIGMTAALLGGCGGQGKLSAPTTTTTTTVPATTTTTKPKPKPRPKPRPTAPLTGLVQRNLAQLRAPAVVVKIDNVDLARPQSGLNQADVVYEEMVEGGLTRLAAVFQSQYPVLVGPVRSGRITDEGIADDLNYPVFAYSGTNGVFLPILRSQPLRDVDDENLPGEFWREPWAPTPHNLYTSAAALAGLSSTHTAPHPLFSYHAPGATLSGAGVSAAASVSIGFPAASVGWSYDPRAHIWTRSQNGTSDLDRTNQPLTAANVVIQFLPYVTSLMTSGEGGLPAPIPTGLMSGAGAAWYFSGGRVVRGSWSRGDVTAATRFVDAKGHTIRLAPGRTWVELLPVGSVPAVAP